MANKGHTFSYVITAALTAGQKTQVSIITEADSTFLVERMYARYIRDFKVQFTDSVFNYKWSNLPVYAANIFGTPEFPAKILDPIALPPSTELLVDLENLDAVNPSDIEIVLEGWRIYAPVALSTRRWYQYVKNTVLPASDVVSDSLQINGDSDFLIKKLIARKDGEASLRMASTEMAGRYLTSQFIQLSNQFGRAILPNIIAHPLKLGRLTLLQYEMRNLTAASNTVQLCFEGVKMWGSQTAAEEITPAMARR